MNSSESNKQTSTDSTPAAPSTKPSMGKSQPGKLSPGIMDAAMRALNQAYNRAKMKSHRVDSDFSGNSRTATPG